MWDVWEGEMGLRFPFLGGLTFQLSTLPTWGRGEEGP